MKRVEVSRPLIQMLGRHRLLYPTSLFIRYPICSQTIVCLNGRGASEVEEMSRAAMTGLGKHWPKEQII